MSDILFRGKMVKVLDLASGCSFYITITFVATQRPDTVESAKMTGVVLALKKLLDKF